MPPISLIGGAIGVGVDIADSALISADECVSSAGESPISLSVAGQLLQLRCLPPAFGSSVLRLVLRLVYRRLRAKMGA